MSVAHEEEWALDGQDEGLIDDNQTAENETADGQEAPQLTELETLASELGWKPENEWKGPKDGWTPADQYLRTTHQKLRESTDRGRDTYRQLTAAQRQAEEAIEGVRRMERVTQAMMQEQEARHRAELDNYFEAQKKAAAKADNEELYQDLVTEHREAQRQLSERYKPQPEVNHDAQAQAMLQDPIVGPFIMEHPWLTEDEDAYALAFAVCEDYAQAGAPKLEQIKAARSALRERYPERFAPSRGQTAPQQRTRQPVIESKPWEVGSEQQPQRQTPAKDERGRFVPAKDAHLYEQQPQRRAPPAVAEGVRVAASTRMSPEAAAWNSLSAEEKSIFKAQKESGTLKMDVVKFAKIARGEQVSVLD